MAHHFSCLMVITNYSVRTNLARQVQKKNRKVRQSIPVIRSKALYAQFHLLARKISIAWKLALHSIFRYGIFDNFKQSADSQGHVRLNSSLVLPLPHRMHRPFSSPSQRSNITKRDEKSVDFFCVSLFVFLSHTHTSNRPFWTLPSSHKRYPKRSINV